MNSEPQTLYRNVSNPAAYGVEWTAADGTRYTLVNPRGTAALWFGIHHDGRWWPGTVVEPARFGLVDPPRSFRDFMAVVHAYAARPQ